MSASRSQADLELLEKLVLGHLPVEEAERLAREFADDDRLAELAQSLSNSNDTLLDSLRNQQTLDDSQTDQLVERLMKRLKGASVPVDAETASVGTESSAPPTELIPEHLEYFRILKVLGQGGMGTVYFADDTRLGRRVALKTLRRELAANPAAKGRFLREARSAAKLHHDHIIPIYYVGESDGIPFLAMPYLEGESLEARIKRVRGDTGGPADHFARLAGDFKPLPIPDALRIARQIALGLSVAHAHGVIHRDIKPGNIWLEAPLARVRILDFGLARTENEAAHLTASGAIMGTPAYMAPEQARGKHVDGHADLFSLGCVLYEMVTGRRPFRGEDTMAILSSLALDTPPAPDTLNPECPPALSELTMQLLHKEPAQRPASAESVARRLSQLEMPTIEIMERAESTPAADPWSQLNESDTIVPMATPAAPEASAKAGQHKRRVLPFVAIALLLGFVGLGIAFGGTIIRVANNEGELVVEVDDPNTEVVVKGSEVEIRREENGKKRVVILKAGKEGEIEVRDPGSDTVLVMAKFQIRLGRKTIVTVTAEKLAAARKNVDTDRKAAEYVLSIGGHTRLTVNGIEANPEAIGELPRGPFELRYVDLNQNAKVMDEGLANFKNCKDLLHLYLNGTQIGDRGLAHLKTCSNLALLHVKKTKVTVQGIAELKKALPNCKVEWDGSTIEPASPAATTPLTAEQRKALEWLLANGGDIQVDVGGKLQNVPAGGSLPDRPFILHSLNTGSIKGLGREAVERLRDVPHVRQNLNFYPAGAELTDDALGKLVTIPGLTTATDLVLLATAVTDAGLVHLKRLRLSYLNCTDCPGVTDVGLEHLAACTRLTQLEVRKTKVTKAGVDKLAAALPQCRITWDGGVIESNRFTNSFGMQFAFVPKGKSWLGGGGGKPGDKEVEFNDDFYIGTVPVTQEEWEKVTGTFPAHFSRNGFRKNDVKDISDADLKRFPVEGVSYADVQSFLAKLNERDNLAGWEYRLPTMAEWEYACRGGPIDKAESAFLFYAGKPSDALPPDKANYAYKGGPNRTVKVGQFEPNKLGLYDMHGLVLEWCSDAGRNAIGEDTRMARGGSWNDPAGTASSQIPFLPTVRYASLGLRVVRARITDPDRRAAEWVLSIGGKIEIDTNGKTVTAVGDLPKTPFRLTTIDLNEIANASDEEFVAVKGCKNLEHVYFGETKIGDAGLLQLKDSVNLRHLNAGTGRLSDAGVAFLKEFKRLSILNLGGKKFVSQLTDTAIEHLCECKELSELYLEGVVVTDVGADKLKAFHKLLVVNLTKTKITGAKVEELRKAMPNCRIHWDGGVIEPKK